MENQEVEKNASEKCLKKRQKMGRNIGGCPDAERYGLTHRQTCVRLDRQNKI